MASAFARWIGQKEFDALPPQERSLLIAAYFADQEKVREAGFNRGFWVERFLASVGLGAGYAWCAAFVYHVLTAAKYPTASLPAKRKAAAVVHWHRWAAEHDLLTDEPRRGDLFLWLNGDGTGHIGFVSKPFAKEFQTIEGNSNKAGSREGDGVYRNTRRNSAKHFSFISLHTLAARLKD